MANQFIDTVEILGDDKALVLGTTKRFALAYSSSLDVFGLANVTGETPVVLMTVTGDGVVTVNGDVTITGDLTVDGTFTNE